MVGHLIETTDVVVGELVEVEPAPLVLAGLTLDPDEGLSDSARERKRAATPPNTSRAYVRWLYGVTGEGEASTVRKGPADEETVPWSRLAWVPYCDASGRRSGLTGEPAHPDTLTQWVSDLCDAGVGPPTITQAIAAVRRLHRENRHKGHPDTTDALDVLKTYRRDGAAAEVSQAAPVTIPILRTLLDHTDTSTVKGRRDALMFVMGVAAMLRRGELVALQIHEVREQPSGVSIYVPKSKTDQSAAGATVVIPRSQTEGSPTDVVALLRAVREDLTEQGITAGNLFRSVDRNGYYRGPLNPRGYDVARILKAAAVRAGLSPDRFRGHSLRSGGATAAHLGGASIKEIMAQGRWKRPAQVVEYIRILDRWTQNAAARMGL